jgi:hypothetical protein
MFTLDEVLKNGLDWQLLQSLYWKEEYLNKDIEWFKNKGYSIVE